MSTVGAILSWLESVEFIRHDQPLTLQSPSPPPAHPHQAGIPKRPLKRKRASRTHLPSPDAETEHDLSQSTHGKTQRYTTNDSDRDSGSCPRDTETNPAMPSTPVGSPRKKKKNNTGAASAAEDDTTLSDLDQTPRPARSAIPSLDLSPITSSSNTSSTASSPTKTPQSDTSSLGRQSSTRRKVSALPQSDRGIVKRQFYNDSFGVNFGLGFGERSNRGRGSTTPAAIQEALQTIQRLNRGRGLLNGSAPAPEHAGFADLREFLASNSLGDEAFTNDANHGSRLRTPDVRRIGFRAFRCFSMDHDEDAWNAEVHNPLLDLILRGFDPVPQYPLAVDFSVCTRASIIKDYHAIPNVDKRIDFSLYVDPAADKNADQVLPAIEELRSSLPYNSVNHCSSVALAPFLLSVSVETKRTGQGFDDALLQTGVWHAAQWRQLRALLRTAARKRLPPETSDDSATERQLAVNRSVREALEELGALHGVVIQGHDWLYLASSPECVSGGLPTSQKTVLWLHERFGSTNSAIGIHKIAAFLTYLRSWCIDVYWPWFQKYILSSESLPFSTIT